MMDGRIESENLSNSTRYVVNNDKRIELDGIDDAQINRKLKLLLFLALIPGILMERALYTGIYSSINIYGIGVYVTLAAILIAYNRSRFMQSKEAWFSLIIMILLLINEPIMGSLSIAEDYLSIWGYISIGELLAALNRLIVVPMVLVLMSTALGYGFQKQSVRYFLIGYGHNLVLNWFCNLPMPFRVFTKSIKGNKKNIVQILLGVALGIPIFILLLVLLSNADNGLLEFLHNIPELPSDWIIRLTVILFGFFISYSFISKNLEDSIRPKIEYKLLSGNWNSITFGIVISMMILAYLIFFGFRFNYMLGINGLPAELTYSEYAVNGFKELNVVSFINIILMVTCMTFCKDEHGDVRKPLKLMLGVLLVFSILLSASALLRLIMYISVYGLTTKRILALWFEILIIIIVMLSAIKLKNRRFRAVYFGIGTTLVWYAMLNYIAPIIAHFLMN